MCVFPTAGSHVRALPDDEVPFVLVTSHLHATFTLSNIYRRAPTSQSTGSLIRDAIVPLLHSQKHANTLLRCLSKWQTQYPLSAKEQAPSWEAVSRRARQSVPFAFAARRFTVAHVCLVWPYPLIKIFRRQFFLILTPGYLRSGKIHRPTSSASG
jgi:hypothetical protein